MLSFYYRNITIIIIFLVIISYYSFMQANLPLLQMELIQHNRYSPSSFLHPSNPPKNGGSSGVSSFGASLPGRHHNFLPPPLTNLPPLLIPFSGALNLSNGSLGTNGFPGDLIRMDLERGRYFQREVNGNGKRTSPDRRLKSFLKLSFLWFCSYSFHMLIDHQLTI